jgi:tryptophan 7-halogenase
MRSLLNILRGGVIDDRLAADLENALRGAGLTLGTPADVSIGDSPDATFPISRNGRSVVVGPLLIGGAGACRACRDAMFAELSWQFGQFGSVDLDAIARATIVKRIERGLLALGHGDLTTRAIVIADGETTTYRVLPRVPCPSCESMPRAPEGLIDAGLAELALELELESAGQEMRYSLGTLDTPKRYRSIGILGGGTAGYLAAMAFRQRMPDVDVAIIESKKIPIISVGEATTPDMVKFLHSPQLMGVDVVDFHQRVQPTFKLGIKFVWGERDAGQFHYPFQYSSLLESYAYDGTIDNQSVASHMMALDRCPLYRGPDGELVSLMETMRFAYHLDNERLVRFLADETVKRGATHIDAVVTQVVTTPDGGHVDHLITEDGQKLKYDLYVDASGFRSLLMGSALKSPFTSYESSLFNDRAWAASCPHGGVVRPYTQATTMSAGWCWRIPFESDDHLGYVFSSRFQNEDDALAEMKRMHPEMGEARLVKFRSGRHQHFIKGNVVALGNAFAFVEPLESTALHLLIFEIEHLMNHFPLPDDEATKAALNTKITGLWDQLRWFLAVHYRFNRRIDSPYWRAAADADISGVADKVAAFRERAPLSDRPSLYYNLFASDFFSSDHALDTLLLGQHVEARLGPPRMSREEHTRRAVLRKRAAERALPMSVALPMLRERPDLLRRLVEHPQSWVRNWVQR